jgi:hypothetical protein
MVERKEPAAHRFRARNRHKLAPIYNLNYVALVATSFE